MSGITNITGVCNLADDSTIEGGFEATVVEVREVAKKDGSGSFFVAKLSDGTPDSPVAEMSVFTAPKFNKGDKIRVSGQGIKKGSYNNKPQIKAGFKSGITVVAKAGSGQQGTVDVPTASSIPGPTVGMAINNALNLLTQGLTHEQICKAVQTAPFWTMAYEVASQVVRLSKSIECGKLAPSVWDKAAQAPAPQPQHNPEKELNDEVPF